MEHDGEQAPLQRFCLESLDFRGQHFLLSQLFRSLSGRFCLLSGSFSLLSGYFSLHKHAHVLDLLKR
jgi:hypothetical protein